MLHTRNWRLQQLEDIGKLVGNYNVVGIGNLDNFPASLLQKLKKNLSDVTFKVTSRNVLKKVLEAKDHKDFVEKLPNQPILILTNNNAFELYTAIKKSKAKSKAKVGMLAPIDIIVPEGDTGLPPGPALSDLKKVGIKAQVRGATIFVPSDTVICKEGEVINGDIVSTLSKLDIKPVELILDVVGVKEEGLIYLKDVLDVDSTQIFTQFVQAVRASVNIAVEAEYYSEMTVNPILTKAYLEAKALDAEVNKDKTENN